MQNAHVFSLFFIYSAQNGLTDSEKESYFHANIHYERNVIAPWPLCVRKCESQAADSKPVNNGNSGNNNNTIVIIDSDDSDCDDVKPPPTSNGNLLHSFLCWSISSFCV